VNFAFQSAAYRRYQLPNEMIWQVRPKIRSEIIIESWKRDKWSSYETR